MMRRFFDGLTGFAIAGALALAFAFSPARSQGLVGPTPTGAGNYGVTLGSIGAHFVLGGGAPPTVSACGTGVGQVFGTDSAYHFTAGTGASGACTATPLAPWGRRPSCVVDTESTTKPGFSIAPNGVITLSNVVDGARYIVQCVGQPGGG